LIPNSLLSIDALKNDLMSMALWFMNYKS
jgi:hypothetical protein